MYVEFKEGTKYAVSNADLMDNVDKFKDAGYVLTDEDLIIDIDDVSKEVIQKMIQLFGITTEVRWTDRGAHLYFIKPKGFRGANSVPSIGFPVEYKHIKNTKYITVKRDGVLRDVDNEGYRTALPEFLMPKRKLQNLYGMSEGDGRNQALYNHRMVMGQIEDWKKVLSFINDYVFAEPLDEKEMNVLLRDIKIDPKAEDAESSIASLIMREYHTVFYNDELWWLRDGEFVINESEMIRNIYQLAGTQKTRFVDEVLKQVKYRSPLVPLDTKFDVKLKNGILRDGHFIPVEYKEFTPYHIDINYNDTAEPVPTVDEYIGNLTSHDEDYRNLLFEILGHSLIVDDEFKRMVGGFFIFVGKGGNGKGTLLTIIRQILGAKNCTALSIQQMNDERYFTTMKGKLANLGDDIQDAPINNEQMKTLKNISTCDYVATRELYKQSREAILTLSLIFTSNHILKTFEKGDSYKRRVKWLPMYYKPSKKDPKFISKLTTPKALEYWLKLLVEGYMRLYEQGRFTYSEKVEKFNAEYHEENNGTLLFVRDHQPEDFIGRIAKEVYDDYEIWAEENGMTPQSKRLFNDTVESEMGMKPMPRKKNGVSYRLFVYTTQDGKTTIDPVEMTNSIREKSLANG